MELQPVHVLVVLDGDENSRNLLRDLAKALGAEVAEVTLKPTLVPFDPPAIQALEAQVREHLHEAAEKRHLLACAREVVERPAQVKGSDLAGLAAREAGPPPCAPTFAAFEAAGAGIMPKNPLPPPDLTCGRCGGSQKGGALFSTEIAGVFVCDACLAKPTG